MKKNFVMPEVTVSIFGKENVVTASGDITMTATYKKTIENIESDTSVDSIILFTY